MVSLKINEVYPENAVVLAIPDEDTGKYNSAIIKADDGLFMPELFHTGFYPVIFEFDAYVFNTEKEAIEAMMFCIDDVLKVIKVMSN